MKLFILSSCLLVTLSRSLPATMLVRDYQPLRHDRYYSGNDKAFVGDPYDFSGVGQSGAQWATLVSDLYFVSANHFHPVISSSVTFWETNSLSGPSHSYTVLGGQQIGGTDLWVGWFGSAVDASIARYPVLDFPTAAEYVGLTLFNYGVDNRVGRNVLEDVQLIAPDFPNAVAFLYDYDDADVPSVGGDETLLAGGDSGAPSFSVANGMLALLGIHSGVEVTVSADSAVPAYIDEINDVLDDNGNALILVPEPGVAALLALALCAFGFQRRTAA